MLSEGAIFGLISGCLTSIGLVFSNISAKTNINIIIMILISFAITDSLSDAIGIYYSTYKDDMNFNKSIKEARNAFLGKAIIPLLMALVFYLTKNIKFTWLFLCIIFMLFIYINIYIFTNVSLNIKILNFILFFIIIGINYFIGSIIK